MKLQLIEFLDEHIKLLEEWESTNELYLYLSHSRPRYLRELNPEAERHTLFYLIKSDDKIIGATWLEDITDKDAKLGIYIAEKEYRGRGIGREVIEILTDIAFNKMKIEKVYLNVRETNINAIRCYKRCGFEITDTYAKSHDPRSTYQGAYQMSLYNKKY